MKTNTVSTEYPYADCVEQDLLPQFLAKGLLYAVRGVAAALLAPLEVLKNLQSWKPVERKIALSWIYSAAMYLCGVEIWILSSRPAVDGHSRAGEVFVLSIAILAIAVLNGRVQRLRAEAKRLFMMDFKRRVA